MSIHLTSDDYVAELVKLADHYEKAIEHWKRDGMSPDRGIVAMYRRRAEAIRWVLALNAYGVPEHEVVV